ncbi:GNAT family N-acetyltransferase [Ensifer canadensis]
MCDGLRCSVGLNIIIEATESDFDALLSGIAPRDVRLVPDSPIVPADVLQMLADLANGLRPHFSPSAWMIVEGDEIVGLCSVVRIPEGGELHIGYGVAPTRQGMGAATRAVASLLAEAQRDTRISAVSAETSIDNIASQRVLERNGFQRIGERVDAQDGPVICYCVFP